jgi:nitronate monooxygenase
VAGSCPVLAAGGIVDGKGLAAVLCLGASGVAMGTRFLATPESRTFPAHKQAILDAKLGDTISSRMWDILWGETWPGIEVRALRTPFTDRWAEREDELEAVVEELRPAFKQAEASNDISIRPMLTGEGAGRIHTLKPAADIVRDTVVEAEQIFRATAQFIT